MEEAYSELYQQFLRLRSLCLRQAALLHQLTTALQKQQGAAVPNAELNDMMSITVQSSQAIPVLFHEKPQPLTVAPQCCISRNVDPYSYLLAEDMSKLCMDFPLRTEEDGKLEPKAAPLLNLNSSRWQGAFSSESKNPGQPDHPRRDRTVHTSRMPASDSQSHFMDFLSQPGGLLMSDIALQSQVCDFCQAVFPGNTTTKGEFIRHLHTHIS
nr:PREDICTED: uncharacterized protein LOC109629048 [Paralichthys olivaceus]XP_019942089.1 PREDICTED: uncharacterized protein LOC109629048 [Paralichthys olivaceus]